MKNWGQQRKELDTHNIWHEEQLQRAKGSKIPLQREFSEGLRIWHPNTDLDDKKKKSRSSKDCIKELLRYRNCWLGAGLVFRAPLWIQTSVVLPTPSCLLNLSWVLHQLSLISWSSLKSLVTSSGADVSPCLILPVLPTILRTWISSAFSSPITM